MEAVRLNRGLNQKGTQVETLRQGDALLWCGLGHRGQVGNDATLAFLKELKISRVEIDAR